MWIGPSRGDTDVVKSLLQGGAVQSQKETPPPHTQMAGWTKKTWLLVASVGKNLKDLSPSDTARKHKMGVLESHKIPVLGRLRQEDHCELMVAWVTE